MKPVGQQRALTKLASKVFDKKYEEFDDYYFLEDLMDDIRATYVMMPISDILARLAYFIAQGGFTKRFYGSRTYHRKLVDLIGAVNPETVKAFFDSSDVHFFKNPKLYYIKKIRYGGKDGKKD